jgi:hypothetical protein
MNLVADSHVRAERCSALSFIYYPHLSDIATLSWGYANMLLRVHPDKFDGE